MGVFYKSERVGLNGKHFFLLKFRTMREGMHGGTPTAAGDDPRLTKIGRWLRKTKLDELPTLYNVLQGDLSLVGPRPDVPGEIESLDPSTRRICLSVRPGIISPATLWDMNEDEYLKGAADPHQKYCDEIKPIKYKMNVEYVQNKSFLGDLKIIGQYLWKILKK